MAAHDRGVAKNIDHLYKTLDEGYWDDVFSEKSYFQEQTDPVHVPEESGLEVGEFDYLAVNYNDKVFLYGEVKSNKSDLSYAEDQLERAENHFEDTDWTVITQTFLED